MVGQNRFADIVLLKFKIVKYNVNIRVCKKWGQVRHILEDAVVEPGHKFWEGHYNKLKIMNKYKKYIK